MSIVNTLDIVTEWARREICQEVKLKVPPNDNEANDENYKYNRVTPACFPLFVPTTDKMPPSILSPIPSLCVRIMGGSDSMTESKGSMTLEFSFSTWSTGTHGQDILKPQEDGTYKVWTGEDAEAYYIRDGDGWRDAWNWVDIALRKLESTSNIDGIAIDRNTPVTFGPFTEQEGIPDFYPFWFTWIRFAVESKLMRNNPNWEQFL